MSKLTCVAYHITISSTALLFLFRVCAIHGFDKYITAGFSIFWLAVLGGSLTAVLSLSGVHIGNTKYCTFSNFKSYRSAANITLALFDTCVFIAISWRLYNSHISLEGDATSIKTTFNLLGKNLSTLPRVLLQDGQKYYMYGYITLFMI